MATKLSEMNIKKVHLVGSPAIRKRYLIVKSEDSNMTDEEKKEADDKAKAEALKKSEDEAAAKAKADSDALAKAEADSKVALEKAAAAEKAVTEKDSELIKSALAILKSSSNEDAKSAAAELEAKISGKSIEKSESKTTATEVAEIVKGLMPDIVKSIEEPIKKSLEESNKKLEEVQKSNALLIGEKVEKEITEISKSFVGDYEKNKEYVRKMRAQLDEEGFKAFVEREQANAETIRKSSAFRELGSTSRESAGDTPYKELMGIANSMIQKSDGKLDVNDAFAKACAERPDLYDSYRNAAYSNTGTRED